MNVRATEMRDRVTVKVRADSKSTGGAPKKTWTDAPTTAEGVPATDWARVREAIGRSVAQDGTVVYEQGVEVIMRYRTDVRPQDYHIEWGGEQLTILGVENVGNADMWLRIMCTRDRPL